MSTGFPPLRAACALLALGLLGAGCKRSEQAEPAGREVAPYIEWCEVQGPARNPCLLSAARVTGDATACGRIKAGAPERTACRIAAARTSGRAEICRSLADRDLVLCAFTVVAEHFHPGACDVLENVNWQGGESRALCRALATGEVEACTGKGVGPELSKLCLRLAAVRLRDAAVCMRLGKDGNDLQRCAAAVVVARRAPQDCAAALPAGAGAVARRNCEVEAAIERGDFPPCFGDPGMCDRSLWVARPCDGTTGVWADDCHIHEAVFSTGPFGCGAVVDPKRRTLCGQLRDAQEGFLRRAHRADGGTAAPAPAR